MSLVTKFFAQRRTAGLQLVAAVLTACSGCRVDKNYVGENCMNGKTEPMIPVIAVEAESQYVLEFPILLAVVVRNETKDTDYLDLPDLDLLRPLDSIAVDLRPVNGGHEMRLGPSFTYREQNLFRTELMAGQAKRMLIDLTQFGQPLSAGHYQLQVSLFERPRVSRSSPAVKVELIDPSAIQRAEAARLRRLGSRARVADFGSWQPFLTSNWNTVSPSPAVGEGASHQIALHLALHRAAYGPEPLARLPADIFRNLPGPVLSAEASALEYEVISERGNKTELEATRSRVLRTWPDLKARLDRIDKGEGVLKTLRRGYGIEKDPPLPPGRHPYTIAGGE